MSTDYSKLKNAELESLLKDRGLPHTGKKADLVARLIEHDSKATSTAGATVPSPASREVADDEIDWDDDTAQSGSAAATSTKTPGADTAAASLTGSTQPATAALAAGGRTRVKNPQAVPNQVPAIDPATTDDLSVVAAPEAVATNSTSNGNGAGPSAIPPAPATTTISTTADEPAEPAPAPTSFSRNLPATSLTDELAKRAARAAKFGTSTPESQQTEKALLRSKRFGDAAAAGTTEPAAQSSVKGLNEALPERRARGRKRDAEGTPAGEGHGDGGAAAGVKRQRGGTVAAAAGETKAEAASKPQVVNGRAAAAAAPKWMSEADIKAAEARKARWATAAPTAPAAS